MQYTLQCGAAKAVADSLGGELISFHDAKGLSYLWTGDACFWSGHAPVLFPIVGALPQNTFTIQGVPYTMPKHGMARKRQWRTASRTESSITFELAADEETLRQYPYRFLLQATHTLRETGFTTQFTVHNADTRPLGCCIGGHAGFCCPLHPQEHFEDYELVFTQAENDRPLYTDEAGILHGARTEPVLAGRTVLPLRYELFENDVLIFDNLLSRSVTLRHKATGKGLVFSFTGFTHLGVWTPPGKSAPFLCLEPWKGLPAWSSETGALEDKPDTVWCEPTGTFSVQYSMEIL